MKKKWESVEQAVAYLKTEGWEDKDGVLSPKSPDKTFSLKVLSTLDFVAARGRKVSR